jgi:hypothetical protein
VAAASGDSGYYVVTAVDAGGTESVQSLAVKPASTASGGSCSILPGCFIATVQDTMPAKAGWVVVAAALGVWLSRRMRDFMS